MKILKTICSLFLLLSVALPAAACASVEPTEDSQSTAGGTGKTGTEITMSSLCGQVPELGRCESVIVTRDGVYRVFAVSGLYGYMEYFEAIEPIADLTLTEPTAVRPAQRDRINYVDAMTLTTRVSGTPSAETGKPDGIYCYAYHVSSDYGTYEFIAGSVYPSRDTLMSGETDVCIVGMCRFLWAERGTGKQFYGNLSAD